MKCIHSVLMNYLNFKLKKALLTKAIHKTQVYLVFGCLLFWNVIAAQGVAINTSGALADGSAMLDISSSSKGMLMPRMSSAERNAIHLLP